MREVSADPAFLTVKEGSKRVASRDLSPVRLTKAVLDRIDHLDRQTKAYVTVFRASAVEAAQEAAQCIKESGPIGPLHGIPVALKDIYDIKDLPTLCGSRVREGHTATADSEVARRLREAGAIIIGKTVTHEFAYGVVSPPTRNPWDLGRIPGGSSGGSGAAVAADLCLAAMGSDTGGSIRIPAALNGIVGIKPTFGRVSKRGVVPGSWSLDHVGPLTKTVADAALLLQALAGYDPADGCSIDVPVPDYLDALNAGVEALRIGVPAKYFFDSVDPQVDSAVRDAISTLEQLGAEVIDVEIPRLELTSPVVLCIVDRKSVV